MADTITVKFKITEDGSLKQVTNESKKAAKGLDNVGNSARNADRNLKGAAQASSNSTKNFSKMAQGTGGLVAAYATLAANIFAISAAYNFLKNAGDLRVLQESQFNYATTTGKSLDLLTSKVQQATGGLLKFEEAAQAVSIGTSAGLSGKQLIGLADVAKKASMALGRDLTDSFNRLTRGAIKAEPELLDELGIIIRLDKVTKDYAATLGKSAKDLTTFQKSQAVVNAVISQGETKFADLGGKVNQITKLGKAFDDVLKGIKETIAPLAEFIGGALANNITALAGAFALLGTGIAKGLGGVGPGAIDLSEQASAAESELRGVGGSSAIGKKLTGGKDLSNKDLNFIESSAKAKSSTVIKYDNITKDAVVRNVRIMKAERALQLAQTETGVKRTYAMWKAELKLLQAQHGTTMGFMKAGMRGFGRVANSVLGAAGALGLLFTVLGILKQIMESFRSDEMKEFLERNEALSDILDDQNSKIGKLVEGFKGGANESDRIRANFELLNNLDLKPSEGLKLDRKEDQSIVNLRDTNNPVKENFEKILKTVDTQLAAFDKAGFKAPEILVSKAAQLRKDLELFSSHGTSIGSNFGTYNELVDRLNVSVTGLSEANEKALEPLRKQNEALAGLVTTGDELLQFQQKLGQSQSKFSTGAKILQDLNTGLTDANLQGKDVMTFGGMARRDANVTDLSAETRSDIEALTGPLKDNLTITKLQTIIEEKRKGVLEAEEAILLAQTKTKIKFTEALRNATPIQKGILASQQQEEEIQNKIAKIQGERNILDILNAEASDSQIAQDKQSILLLQAQLGTQQDLTKIKLDQQKIEERLFELANDKTLHNAKQEMLSLEQKSLKIAKEKEALAQKDRDRATTQAKRGFKQSSPFSSLFQGKFDAKIELAQAVKEREEKVKALEAERKMKEDLIEMEYILLDAKLEALALEMRLKAADKNNGLTRLDRFHLELGARRVDTSRGKIPGMKAGALANAGAAETSGIADIDEGIAALADKKRDLEDIQVLTKGIAESLSSGMSQAFADMATGAKSAKQAFADMAKSILSNIASMIAEMLVMKMIKGMFGLSFEGGGVMKEGKKVPSYSTGGIARGSSQGHPAILHGTEAVVPLPNGKSIPVEMKSSGNVQNNVVVNVSTDGTSRTESSSGMDADRMGRAVAAAVQAELQNQKRSGGILNPYGVA